MFYFSNIFSLDKMLSVAMRGVSDTSIHCLSWKVFLYLNQNITFVFLPLRCSFLSHAVLNIPFLTCVFRFSLMKKFFYRSIRRHMAWNKIKVNGWVTRFKQIKQTVLFNICSGNEKKKVIFCLFRKYYISTLRYVFSLCLQFWPF